MLSAEDPGPTQPVRCPADGMPLYATLVGPRCPVCGAGGPASLGAAA